MGLLWVAMAWRVAYAGLRTVSAGVSHLVVGMYDTHGLLCSRLFSIGNDDGNSLQRAISCTSSAILCGQLLHARTGAQ